MISLTPCFNCLLLLFFSSSIAAASTSLNFSAAALIFGDSTVDSGNNEHIPTIFRSNFYPYGKDFINHRATGRFTNGRLVSDFIAENIGLKDYIPAYLDPELTIDDLMTGVSFASAGSGYDSLTAEIGNVIPVLKQLEYFKEYKLRLENVVGENKMREIINETVFIISAGTNDFILNYFLFPFRRAVYTVQGYTDFVQQQVRQLLQGLIDNGARRIAVAGLPPMGCLPIVITLYGKKLIGRRNCIDKYSAVARDYNEKLKTTLGSIQEASMGTKIVYLDIYRPLEDMTLSYKYEFEEVSIGCCGTGRFELSILCNGLTPLCKNATKYVFWDAVHPSEKAYAIISEAILPALYNLIAS